jgi:hypothetical protein
MLPKKIQNQPHPIFSNLPPGSIPRPPPSPAGHAPWLPPAAARRGSHRRPRAVPLSGGRALFLPPVTCAPSVQPAASLCTSRHRGSHCLASQGFGSAAALAASRASGRGVLREVLSHDPSWIHVVLLLQRLSPQLEHIRFFRFDLSGRRSMSLIDCCLLNAMRRRNGMHSCALHTNLIRGNICLFLCV